MSNNMSISSIKEHYNNLCTKAKEWSAAYYEQDAPVVKAAESCDFHDAFASDIKRCENALGMGGLVAINAECWLDVLSAMPDTEIAEYVRTKYKPGLLNPFKGTSLYIKS